MNPGKSMILVVSSSFDKTVDYIQLKHNVDNFYRFNIDHFSNYDISYNHQGFCINDSNGKQLLEKNCCAIYYRKPVREILPKAFNSIYINHIGYEVFSLIHGIVDSFKRTCLTKPFILKKADNKVYQLRKAYEVGFEIPEPLITNNMDWVKKHLNKPIVKPLSSGTVEFDNKQEFVQTNLVDFNKETTTLKYGPCYFQEYQDKDFEVSITVVNNFFFPIKIISKNNVDWRKSNNEISYELIDIPLKIKEKCITFMKMLDIKFGCFDFIVKNNKWYFLEINANGQWAWLEIELGLSISAKIIEYLQ